MLIYSRNIDAQGWRSEYEKKERKKQVFKKLQKHRLLRSLEKQLGITDADMRKYMDGWESKSSEPNHVSSLSYHYVGAAPSASFYLGMAALNHVQR